MGPDAKPLARDYQIVAGRFLSAKRNAYDMILVEIYAREKKIELGAEVSLLTSGGATTLRVVSLMAPEIKDYMKREQHGQMPTFAETMRTTPMGKGLYEPGLRTGIVREESTR